MAPAHPTAGAAAAATATSREWCPDEGRVGVRQLLIQHLREEVENQALHPRVSDIMNSVFESGYTQSRAAHPLWHLWYVLQGRALIEVGDTTFTAGQGDVFLIPGWTSHKLDVPPPDACHMFEVKFAVPAVDATLAAAPISGDGARFHARDDFGLRPTIHTLLLEAEMRPPEWQTAVRGLFEEILSRVLRRLPAPPLPRWPDGPARPQAPARPELVGRAAAFVAGHAGRPLRARDVAAHVDVNARVLTAAFKRTTGCTLTEFVVQSRLDRARQLLAGTDLPVKAVAREAGYRSVHYFSRAFRAHVGLTPTAFRQRHRG